MVKKTYINPEIIVVRLMPTTSMLQASETYKLDTSGDNKLGGEGQNAILTKGVSDVNVWDEEW